MIKLPASKLGPGGASASKPLTNFSRSILANGIELAFADNGKTINTKHAARVAKIRLLIIHLDSW